MKKVLELQKLNDNSEVQPQIGPTITTITIIPTTLVSFLSNYCDNHVS
ncbi:class III lanthipeptide [Bacillus andreraoultii]|nr:class III lanthipeptide [Bacillus andreraoultii]